jgi:hypothetical protein
MTLSVAVDPHDDREYRMETRRRTGWATAMVVLAIVVGAVFVIFLLMTLVGILG